MAHGKSSKKRMRQSETRRQRNKSQLTALRTQLKKVRQAIATGNAEKAQAELRVTARALDKAATKGVIHRNNASRHKSRLAQAVAKLTATPA